jgi:uncharacterized membrane protein
MRSLLHRFRDEDGEEGAIAVLTAALLVALMVATSLAVDVGKVAYGSRDQQGATDRAALDSVQVLGQWDTAPGLTAAQLKDYAEERFADNAGFGSEERRIVRVTLGVWEDGVFKPGTLPDVEVWTAPGFPDPGRFPDGPPASKCTETAGVTGVSFNAVCIDTESFVPFSFSLGSDENGRWILKSAIAALTEPIASISAGSTLAELQEGAAEELLRLLLGGGELDLSLVGHEGVAQASIDLPQLAAQLGAGTVDEFLTTEVILPELLTATLGALSANDEETVQVAAEGFLGQLSSAVTLSPLTLTHPYVMGDILALDPGPGAGLTGQVDVFSFVTAALFAANRENGVGLDADVAGLPIRLAIVEPPQVAVGPPGSTVARTAQLRLEVDVPLEGVLRTGPSETDSGTAAEVAEHAATVVEPLRDRIDALGSCLSAVGSTGQRIADDIEDAVEEAEAWAAANGLLPVVSSLVSTTLGVLGSLFDGLGCVVAPSSTLASVKADLHEAADGYRDILVRLAGGDEVTGTVTGTLAVSLASAEAALSAIGCDTAPRTATMDVVLEAGSVALSTLTLADLDLGILGKVTVSIGGELALAEGGSYTDQLFEVPETKHYVTSSYHPVPSTAGLVQTPIHQPELFAVPGVSSLVDPIVAEAAALLDPILTELQAQLDGLSALGLDVGTADVTAMWVGRCGGRRLVQ